LANVEVREQIQEVSASLTVAERRVAEVVLQRPEVVAFGTVAELAAAAHAGAATVVRLAGKLGFDGFSQLQAAVQADMARRLRPAAERIRNPVPDDVLDRVMYLELDNVQTTFAGVSPQAFATAVDLLTDTTRSVAVLSGDAERGVARQFEHELAVLRPRVGRLAGDEVAVARAVALLEPGDVVVAVDLRRYERWVLDAAAAARGRGAALVTISDSLLSPLGHGAMATFVVSAGGAGPFDSHVGTLALFNALLAACAGRLRAGAQERLDRIEAAWVERGALSES
jgi:DNA-binding MurR/RpiR family transcriptional regulator